MSDASESSPAEALLFPAFMYGDRTTCRRKARAEAKKWAKYYLEGREFPEPKLLPIAPGSIVFTDENYARLVGLGYSFSPHANVVTISNTAKEEGRNIQWRPYMLEDLQFEAEIAAKLSRAECFPFRGVFVPFVCRYAWGAISAATIGRLLNSIELTVPRIEGVLRHWEALDTLRYVIDAQPISLTEFILSCFKGQLAMWVDQPTRNIRTDLQSAVDQMRQASKEEIHLRLIDRLGEMADTERNLEHREWLESPGVIEAGLEAERRKGQDQYDNLTSGDTGELWGFLYQLDKTYPESLH